MTFFIFSSIIILGDLMNILVIGSSSYDHIIHVDKIDFDKDDSMFFSNNSYYSVGSTGAGKALCLDALSKSVKFITDIANDEYGEKIRSVFDERHLDYISLNTKNTTTHTNLMTGEKRVSIFTSISDVLDFNPEHFSSLILNADAVMLNINNFAREFIPLIKKYRKLCIVDLHDYNEVNPYHEDFIKAANMIFVSGVNLRNEHTFMNKMIESGKDLVVVTKGKNGYIAKDSDNNLYQEDVYDKLETLDTNGAGDAFSAGFTHHYISTLNIGKSLKYGNVCGAVACSSTDLFNLKYTNRDILNILKKELDY